MTMVSLIFDGLLALMAGGMFLRGKFGATRQLAVAPLAVAVLDAAFANKIQPMLTPVLSVLVLCLQLAVLVSCGHVLEVDRARAKSKARRRQLHRSRAAFEAAMGERSAHCHSSSERCDCTACA